MYILFLIALVGLLLGASGATAQTADTNVSAAPAADLLKASDADMQWWRDARFGLFVHWGPVSLKGTEIGWSRGGERRGTGGGKGEIPVEVYDNLYKEFNPVKFNAKEWVAIAKSAGMKYLVFTTRHHDGFSEFDSQMTDYKITNSPFGRDVVKELSEACHEAGLRLGFYYSPPDWHHPDYRTAQHARFLQYMHGQIRELCSNYGQLDVLWFDGLGGTAQYWDAVNLFKMIRSLQPHILINNRAGLTADFDTPEQTIGRFQNTRPWESCITICQQWAYKPNDKMKSAKECIDTLVRCAGGDGNLLFNVGPMPTGEIEPRQVERLKEMGAWLAKYGETIYGSRGGPFRPTKTISCTCNGNTAYVHVLAWHGDTVVLPAIRDRKIVSSPILTGGEAEVKMTDDGIAITVPKEARQELDTIVALELDGPAFNADIANARNNSVTRGKAAKASNIYQNMPEHGPDKAVDGDPETRWATNAGTHSAWLEIDLGAPARIGSAYINEALDRVKGFALERWENDAWIPFAEGKTIGGDFEMTFPPVTTQRVRLNIREATEGPTIWEFDLFPAK
jgi:alpha-L-fucosidase